RAQGVAKNSMFQGKKCNARSTRIDRDIYPAGTALVKIWPPRSCEKTFTAIRIGASFSASHNPKCAKVRDAIGGVSDASIVLVGNPRRRASHRERATARCPRRRSDRTATADARRHP